MLLVVTLSPGKRAFFFFLRMERVVKPWNYSEKSAKSIDITYSAIKFNCLRVFIYFFS